MNRFRRFTVEPALRFSLVLLSYLCQTINVLVLSGNVSVQLGKVKAENRISQIFIPNLTSFQSSGASLGRRPGFVPESECKVTPSFSVSPNIFEGKCVLQHSFNFRLQLCGQNRQKTGGFGYGRQGL